MVSVGRRIRGAPWVGGWCITIGGSLNAPNSIGLPLHSCNSAAISPVQCLPWRESHGSAWGLRVGGIMTGGHRGLSPDYGVLSVEDFASFFILDYPSRISTWPVWYLVSLLSLSRWGSVSWDLDCFLLRILKVPGSGWWISPHFGYSSERSRVCCISCSFCCCSVGGFKRRRLNDGRVDMAEKM